MSTPFQCLEEFMAQKQKKDEFQQDVLLKRLRRIEGQVRGIEKMIVAERDCESVLTQLAAVRSAIESAGALVLNNYMKLCFNKNNGHESDSVNSLERAICIWGRGRVGEVGD